MAIITGGVSGIGEGAVHLFWENGATVIIADIQGHLGQAIADNLGKNGTYIHCNVTEEDEVIKLIDSSHSTVSMYGKPDIMYNNAGIIRYQYGRHLKRPKV